MEGEFIEPLKVQTTVFGGINYTGIGGWVIAESGVTIMVLHIFNPTKPVLRMGQKETGEGVGVMKC